MTEAIPILSVGDTLLVSVQADLHDVLILRLADDLAARVEETGARGVIVDISGVSVVDSYVARKLTELAGMTALLGATLVLVAMRPAVALTLVEMGIGLGSIPTARDVDAGLALLRTARR